MQGFDAQSLKSVSDEIMQAVDAAENLEALDAIRVNACLLYTSPSPRDS